MMTILKEVEGFVAKYDEEGKLHSTYGPALIFDNGDEFWYWHGQLHNANGPAVQREDEHIEYWIFGEKHREHDLPAVIRSSGTEEWWWYNKKHRENDQPAVRRSNGNLEWWFNGVRHRNNNPAWIKMIDNQFFAHEYWDNGVKHRAAGPAFEDVLGNKEHWYAGKLHNVEDAAVFYADGTKYWYEFGNKIKRFEPKRTVKFKEITCFFSIDLL